MKWIQENKLVLTLFFISILFAITTTIMCGRRTSIDTIEPFLPEPDLIDPLPEPEPHPKPIPPQPIPPHPQPEPDPKPIPPNPSPQPNPEPQIIVPTPLCKQGWILLRMSLESTRDYFSEHQEGCLWCNWKLQKYLCEVGRTLFKDHNESSKFKEHCKTCYKCRKYVGEVYVRN